MSAKISRQALRDILEGDRLWTAYALADLDPFYAAGASWYASGKAVVLHYQGLNPPALFLYGPNDELTALIDQLPAGEVQFMVRPENLPVLRQRLRPESEVEMWRMALDSEKFEEPVLEPGIRRLETEDLEAINQLIEGHPDQPDAFSQFQLEHGVFYGRWAENRLMAIAGTHVLSSLMDVAAVGNVFTDPSQRRRGFGRQVSAAVVADLCRQNIGTIVLNVAQANQPALRIYRGLGFWPVYGYHEGVGSIQP
jgi:ribosomal protein S18 acetylase RimI-like enzyme